MRLATCIIERFLGIGQNQTNRMEYPYSATLASELEGKIEAKYNWGKNTVENGRN